MEFHGRLHWRDCIVYQCNLRQMYTKHDLCSGCISNRIPRREPPSCEAPRHPTIYYKLQFIMIFNQNKRIKLVIVFYYHNNYLIGHLIKIAAFWNTWHYLNVCCLKWHQNLLNYINLKSISSPRRTQLSFCLLVSIGQLGRGGSHPFNFFFVG